MYDITVYNKISRPYYVMTNNEITTPLHTDPIKHDSHGNYWVHILHQMATSVKSPTVQNT